MLSSQQVNSSREQLINDFLETRHKSTAICRNLEIEDYVTQPVPEVSPPKWHLGHTTWFFEEMLLAPFVPGYQRFNDQFGVLFNSYYKAAGKHWVQSERGDLSRPTVKEVLEYRQRIDDMLAELLQQHDYNEEIDCIIELGLHHEQQHQELLLMDIKYILGVNPLLPGYAEQSMPASPATETGWLEFDEGLYEVGHTGNSFAYDNEQPRHKTYVYPFNISKSLVTNAEYLEFINDEGYSKPEHWLSKGFDFINQNNISRPLYWQHRDAGWYEYTLYGLQPLQLNAPVCHLSYFEAHAYASWRGLRLPTEQESELALDKINTKPVASESSLHPVDCNAGANQVWQWTSSHYSPYPGYQAYEGPLQEYNGKFMCNQFVLRGGCIATPTGHFRNSYRNFYEPHQRWMFSGIRLAEDAA